jgi:hypothetical protein
LDDWGGKNELVVLGKRLAQDPRPEQDAREDLNHHQRRVIVGFAHTPDQVRHSEDDRHGDQKYLGGVHGMEF